MSAAGDDDRAAAGRAALAARAPSLAGRAALLVEGGAVQEVVITAVVAAADAAAIAIAPLATPSVRLYRAIRRADEPLFETPHVAPGEVARHDPDARAVTAPTTLTQPWAWFYADDQLLDGSTYAGWRLVIEPRWVAAFRAGDDTWWTEAFE